MANIIIFGATSAIAQAVARVYASQGAYFILVARNSDKLKSISDDLIARSAKKVDLITCDFEKLENIDDCVVKIKKLFSYIDIALIAHGVLPTDNKSLKSIQKTLTINIASTFLLMENVAQLMQEKKQGIIAVISSVSGDRGRQGNYLYAASKAAVSTFASGLRIRLYKSGIHLLLIKPGFIDTPMTTDFKKNLLWSNPEAIAPKIINAISKRKNTLYVPRFWWFIMLIIKYIPEFIFKRMKL